MSMIINPGLVFSIPLSETTFGFGQLIAWQAPIFYMIAYDMEAESSNIDGRALQKASPSLMGNFFDVLIHNRRWKSIGIFPVPDVPFPCFKIKIRDRFYIESWDRTRKREATPDETAVLQFRTNYGPIILEDALKAHFKLIPWDKMFEPLKSENVARIEKMC